MLDLQIKNFKSIDELELQLGRVNLFIGENGCGKTSILEAVGMAAAGAVGALSTSALKDRGIRLTEPRWMRSGFPADTAEDAIDITLSGGETKVSVSLVHDDTPFGEWKSRATDDALRQIVVTAFARPVDGKVAQWAEGVARTWLSRSHARELALDHFLVYAPREDVLRDLARDSDVEPIGVHGEGLFRLLKTLDDDGQLPRIKEQLAVLGWFDDLSLAAAAAPSSRALQIQDVFLDGQQPFDQRSVNEGFLFVLLYACLLTSQHTPKFFAVDNVDTALNPKLCARVVKMFAGLAQANDRRVMLTAHNPGALDGLDLHDDEQRLFVVYRNIDGKTRVRRILPVDVATTDPPIRLSEAFLRGYLGALPTNF